jgi:type IV secretion system protein VirD4
VERATDLIAATSRHAQGGDREFWEAQARRVLAALLHAAALDGELDMHAVQGWVTDPDSARRQVTSLLRRSRVVAFEQDATQFVTTNDKTRSSITSTIMPALGWLTSPAACEAATGGAPFDVAALLAAKATVYLLGAEETQAAPLVCALTGHIAREARRIAATCPGGRLDPPLSLHLDEAALICPVPLHRWTADMGGRGVTIVAAFQSRAQLLDRYGDANAAVIINNAGARILFGGTGDRDDLNYWSTLAGDRDEPITTTDLHGRVASRSVRKVPVLAPAQLANLPAGRVVVWRRGMAPVVGRAEMAYRRHDVRAAHGARPGWWARLRECAAGVWARRPRRAGQVLVADVIDQPGRWN